MSDFKVRVVSNITKEYPDMIKVIIYKEPKFFSRNNCSKRNRDDVSDDFCPKISSLNRTKTLVKDIVLCNDFELFCTFTFNPKKCNSFSLSACWHKMSTWISHQRDNARLQGRELKYLIIPEQHKSGRWHFHALISGYTGSLKPARAFSPSDRPIYNITSFRSGFTTAVRIDSKEGVSNYVTKYITKSFVRTFNQRRFFCSRNLIRPTKVINSTKFFNVLPLFRRNTAVNRESYEYIIDSSFLN